MAVRKTGIAVDETLANKLDTLAGRLGVRRSVLVNRAIANLVNDIENEELLARLNAVYGDVPSQRDREDRAALEGIQRLHSHQAGPEW